MADASASTTQPRMVRLGRRVLLLNKAMVFAVLLAAGLSLSSPYFLTSINLFALLDQIVVMTLVALGYTLILAIGEIDLSVGGVIALTGVIMGKLMTQAGLPVEAAVLAGLAIGGLCGALNATVISRFGLPPFIVTLATNAVFTGLLYILSNLVPVSNLPASFVAIARTRLWGVPLPFIILVPFIVAFYLTATRSVFGQHVLALGGNPEAVRVAGIDIDRLRLKTYVAAGITYGGAAVLLTARSASAQIAAGSNLLLVVIAAVVIGGTPLLGGKADIVGTVFGCLIIGMIGNGLNLLGVNANYQIIVQGLLILLALVVDVESTKMLLRLDRAQMLRSRRPDR